MERIYLLNRKLTIWLSDGPTRQVFEVMHIWEESTSCDPNNGYFSEQRDGVSAGGGGDI